uniref:Uncharacterized protein n=1 Tax=Tanacetum cinerariifolium TaxID=118510 RepID=A0A6L2LU95_TANCI|nr:hypothetical protein [Tanacetum cinerariifolium]
MEAFDDSGEVFDTLMGLRDGFRLCASVMNDYEVQKWLVVFVTFVWLLFGAWRYRDWSQAVGEVEGAAKCLEHMKVIVSRDALTLWELETLLACAQVGVSLKAGFVADMEHGYDYVISVMNVCLVGGSQFFNEVIRPGSSSSVIMIFRPSGLVTRDIATHRWNYRLFLMKGHCVCVDVSVIYGINTVCPTFDPAFIAWASSFLGVKITRSFRYAPSLFLVVKSRNVSFIICSIGDSAALIMKSFRISI